jgi:hypothetical protein
MPGSNAPYTALDASQVLTQSFDETTDRIRVDAALTVDIPGGLEVSINATDDSIKIGNTATGPFLNVNSDGSVNVEIEGLPTFQTSQYTIGTSAVQLTTVPLTNRSSVSIKAVISNNTDTIYIGNSSSVTTSNGYPLYNDDSLSMDLKGSQQIWAIGTTTSLKVCVLEIG